MWSQLLCHIAAMYHSFNFLRPNIGCVYACIGKEMYYIIIVFLIGYITLSEYTTTNLYLWQQVLSGTTCWNEILLYYVHHMSIQIKISLNCILESGIISFHIKRKQKRSFKNFLLLKSCLFYLIQSSFRRI